MGNSVKGGSMKASWIKDSHAPMARPLRSSEFLPIMYSLRLVVRMNSNLCSAQLHLLEVFTEKLWA